MSVMGRRALIFLVFAAVWTGALAQTHYLSHVHVGGHAGVTLSSMSFYPSVKQEMIQGLTAGVSFRYAEERHVGLQAELNIEQSGWKEDYEGLPFKYERQLTYLRLPVMTHIFFGSRVVKFFFNLGPEVSYMLGEKISSNFDYAHASTNPQFPASRRYEQLDLPVSNRFDYGITGGAGVEFVIRRRHCVALEGRYYFGLGNIFPSTKKDYFSASRATSILITLAYKFRLK